MGTLSKAKERRLARMLEEAEVVTPEQWKEIMSAHHENEKDIEQILEEKGYIKKEELGILTSMQDEVSFIDLHQYKIDPQVLRLIPMAMAHKYKSMPIAIVNEMLIVAMDDPHDFQAIEDLAAMAGRSIEAVQSNAEDIEEYINLNYRSGGEIEQQVSSIADALIKEASKGKMEDGTMDVAADSPIARTVNMILGQALKDKASDVHIEPQEDRLRIRYRIDGILHDAMSLPLDVHLPLISRLKIMAGMNIAERRRPQDGQLSLDIEGRHIDVRVASTDTVCGEKIVMRILDKSFALLDLTELGFLSHDMERFRQIIHAPFGMILLSGPTGSGKTTTLYSALGQLNRFERNIMTIEDPVEYHFGDISQISVNEQAGMTFSAGLRALMRLDPDVILVGEIRDAETAGIAIQAALTGHLVLSSIHANDAVGVVYRLMDLGVEPFLISSALLGVVAQRMVRRVCTHCKKPITAPTGEREIYEKEMKEKRNEFFYGQGCSSCANTGYKGRTGVHELLTVSEDLRRLILNNAPSSEIRNQAINDGMTTMWHNAMLRVQQGITTPYEVLRNVGSISDDN
jgi:general secretion pathway protein E